MLDRFDREIDVEVGPCQMVGSRPENIQYLVDRCLGKPRELPKIDEQLPSSKVQPEAVP